MILMVAHKLIKYQPIMAKKAVLLVVVFYENCPEVARDKMLFWAPILIASRSQKKAD